MGKIKKIVLAYLGVFFCFMSTSTVTAQQYDTISTPSLVDHIKVGVSLIDNRFNRQECKEFAREEFDFVQMESSLGSSTFDCLDSIRAFRIRWTEYDVELSVNVIEGDTDTFYGFLSIDELRFSKGILVRSNLDELYYVKLKQGFLSYSNINLIPGSEIVNNVEAIYLLSGQLLPVNIATFEGGLMKSLELNGQFYEFTDECKELIPNLSTIGFDVISMIMSGLECTFVSSQGEVKKYDDWLAYFEFDTKSN